MLDDELSVPDAVADVLTMLSSSLTVSTIRIIVFFIGFIAEIYVYTKLWCLLPRFYIRHFFLSLIAFLWFYLQLSGTE